LCSLVNTNKPVETKETEIPGVHDVEDRGKTVHAAEEYLAKLA